MKPTRYVNLKSRVKWDEKSGKVFVNFITQFAGFKPKGRISLLFKRKRKLIKILSNGSLELKFAHVKKSF